MYQKRQGLAVWLKSTKKVRQLRKYGLVHYVSKRMKYAVLYCDLGEEEDVVQALASLSFVTDVQRSPRTELNFDFAAAFQEEKAKMEQS
ncbi:uncharacterized protein YlbG (UPF0298 family) [Salsuginibacillus halophilus]|uniref:Uncharacterized protein YlbG (UPF0298 family) n=1 Tax=Salsuginibacillus halophilus TaxID=517424 RepID=A0A2P8HX24_9BACI|nr:YlbG family protein [Salsuginibacillus halophilus]PSL50793.1 uncharacterized protein YlbG (UPF0298 family) [Salsuginibacillus halophilus]